MTIRHASMRVLAIATCVFAACASPPTALVVRVDTNMTLGTELQGFRLSFARDGESMPFSDEYHVLVSTTAWPATVLMLPHDPHDRRSVVVVLTGSAFEGGAVRSVVQMARAPVAYGHVTELDLFLARECADPARQQACGVDQTCSRGGDCVPIDRTTLPDFTPDASVAAAADAGDAAQDRADAGLVDTVAAVDAIDATTPDAIADGVDAQEHAIADVAADVQPTVDATNDVPAVDAPPDIVDAPDTGPPACGARGQPCCARGCDDPLLCTGGVCSCGPGIGCCFPCSVTTMCCVSTGLCVDSSMVCS